MARDPRVEAQFQAAERVKAREVQSLRQFPNVIGVGVGYREVAGRRTQQVAVRVYVRHKLPPSALKPSEILPRTVDGIPVDVIEDRFFTHQVALDPDPTIWRSPLRGGISIGNFNVGGSGTLACPVFDNSSGEQLMLSNWHVFCGSPDCSVGEPIIQPGQGGGDGGRPEDLVGRLLRSALTDRVDCAVARLSGNRLVVPEILGLGRPGPVLGGAYLGEVVRKSGRTTRVTQGTITDASADIDIGGYPDGTRHFHGQIVIEGDTAQSRPGDSGSLWMDEQNRPVGLNFAGSSGTGRAIANPIAAVVEALGVSFQVGIPSLDAILLAATHL